MNKIITLVFLLISLSTFGAVSTNKYTILASNEVYVLVQSALTNSGAVPETQVMKINAPIQARRASNVKALNGTWSWPQGGAAKATYNWLTNQMRIMEQNGWLAAGYNFLLIDEGWQGGRTNGIIYEDPVKWPVTIAQAVKEAHSRGFKIGLYQEPSVTTVTGLTGSAGYIAQDAQTFASWGIDFIKWDIFQTGMNREYLTAQFSSALDYVNWKGHLHIGLGAMDYEAWIPRYAESWRSSLPGSVDVIGSTVANLRSEVLTNFSNMMRHNQDAGYGRSVSLESFHVAFSQSTPEVTRFCMALHAMAGNGILCHGFPESSEGKYANAYAILTSKAFDIANFPTMGVMIQSNAVPLYPPAWGLAGGTEVWQKSLDNGRTAILLLNRDPINANTITLYWPKAGFKPNSVIDFEDAFSGTIISGTTFIREIPAGQCELYITSSSTNVSEVYEEIKSITANQLNIDTSSTRLSIGNQTHAPIYGTEGLQNAGNTSWVIHIPIPEWTTQAVWTIYFAASATNAWTNSSSATYWPLTGTLGRYLYETSINVKHVEITNTSALIPFSGTNNWPSTNAPKTLILHNTAGTNSSGRYIVGSARLKLLGPITLRSSQPK